jgi:hypothetical protein
VTGIARRLLEIGARVLLGVGGLALVGALLLGSWDPTIGIVLLVLGAVTWWGLATARALRSLEGTAASAPSDGTITPQQAAQIESADDAARELGGGGDGGGG